MIGEPWRPRKPAEARTKYWFADDLGARHTRWVTDAHTTALVVVGENDEEPSALLDRELTVFNNAAVGVHEKPSLSVRVTAGDGNVIAGLTGWTWGPSAGISMMWVHADHRREGWGGTHRGYRRGRGPRPRLHRDQRLVVLVPGTRILPPPWIRRYRPHRGLSHERVRRAFLE